LKCFWHFRREVADADVDVDASAVMIIIIIGSTPPRFPRPLDNNAWMDSGVIFRFDKRQISLPPSTLSKGAAVGAIRSGPTAGAAFEIYDFLTIGNRLWSGFIIWPGKLLNFNSKIMPHSAVLMNCAARPISMTFLWPRRRMSNDFWALIRP